ncbi:hypothetical protein EVAR_69344_1 [Eumeta japonica]|uniref:Uncharacterized protein n=1 Tax=Eumeta variegata TaxID=151549 RepID=A0A4C2A4Z5_EUMVA|nr:hypothetical protein EVAR_69344_1 [Eumeta japonica]
MRPLHRVWAVSLKHGYRNGDIRGRRGLKDVVAKVDKLWTDLQASKERAASISFVLGCVPPVVGFLTNTKGFASRSQCARGRV